MVALLAQRLGGVRGWRRAAASVLVAVMVLPGVVRGIDLMSADRGTAARESTTDTRLVANERIAAWFGEVRRPGDTIYAMCASAALYAVARVDPPYPYLWWDGVRQIPGALDRLTDLLRSPQAPTYVAVYLRPASCDPSGEVQQLLDDRYEQVRSIEGIPILRLRTAD